MEKFMATTEKTTTTIGEKIYNLEKGFAHHFFKPHKEVFGEKKNEQDKSPLEQDTDKKNKESGETLSNVFKDNFIHFK
jgi:hypothetical protein